MAGSCKAHREKVLLELAVGEMPTTRQDLVDDFSQPDPQHKQPGMSHERSDLNPKTPLGFFIFRWKLLPNERC